MRTKNDGTYEVIGGKWSGKCVTKKRIEIPKENVYVQTVLNLFKRYMIEEAAGYGSNAELRLKSHLEMARELHSEARKEMIDSRICMTKDEAHKCEVIFV